MHYLALGDSYTVGEGVAAGEAWPVKVATLAREHGLAVADPQIIARTGWTTGELLAEIERTNVGAFQVVSLLIGVNDQYRGHTAEQYRAALYTLFQWALAFAAGDARRVIVLSIPDWGVTPFAAGRDRGRIAAEIDQFNAINRAEAQRAGAFYIDVTTESRQASSDQTLLAQDGLHPSGKLYDRWARLVLPAFLAALGQAQGR